MANIRAGLENIAKGGANTLNFIAQLRMQQQANAIREKRFMLQQQFESQQKQKEIDAANEREMNSQRFQAKENELDRELQRDLAKDNLSLSYSKGQYDQFKTADAIRLGDSLFGTQEQILKSKLSSLYTQSANYGSNVNPVEEAVLQAQLRNVQSQKANFLKSAIGESSGFAMPNASALSPTDRAFLNANERVQANPANTSIPSVNERLNQKRTATMAGEELRSQTTGNRSNTINPEWTATGDTSKMSLKQGKAEMVTMISPEGREVKIAKNKVKKAQDQGYKLKGNSVGKYQIRVVE